MPRVYITTEKRECDRFSDFVRGTLKRKGLRHKDLADELGITQVAVTKRINGATRWTLPEMIQTIMFLDTEWTIGGGNGR